MKRVGKVIAGFVVLAAVGLTGAGAGALSLMGTTTHESAVQPMPPHDGDFQKFIDSLGRK